MFALLVVAGLVTVWLAMTGVLRQTYYGSANGVAGELVEGRTAGQTFRAQHDGLSAVDLQLATYSHRLGGVVVLHLRQDVTHTVDLATVRLPGAAIADNAWTRFAFPPIPNSRGQSYYVELEHQGGRPGAALTAYWWLGAGDPTPTAAPRLTARRRTATSPSGCVMTHLPARCSPTCCARSRRACPGVRSRSSCWRRSPCPCCWR